VLSDQSASPIAAPGPALGVPFVKLQAITTVPAPAVQPFDVRTTVTTAETGAGGSLENSESGRNRRRAMTGVG